MKTKTPCPRRGKSAARAAADHFQQCALDLAEGKPVETVETGPPERPAPRVLAPGTTTWRVIPNPSALEQAARLLRRTPPVGLIPTSPPPCPYTQALDIYGTEQRALEVIQRHVETMGDDLDPAVTRRALRLVASLQVGHDATPIERDEDGNP